MTASISCDAHRSSLARRKERVGPRAVIGGVDDSDDVGEPGPKKTLNALPDGDLGKAASLTAAFEADVHAAFGDVWPWPWPWFE